MKIQIELQNIKQQLEYAIEEVRKKRTDKNILHDWLTEAHNRLKQLTMQNNSNSICKYNGCTKSSTCGDYCGTHCNCRKFKAN